MPPSRTVNFSGPCSPRCAIALVKRSVIALAGNLLVLRGSLLGHLEISPRENESSYKDGAPDDLSQRLTGSILNGQAVF